MRLVLHLNTFLWIFSQEALLRGTIFFIEYFFIYVNGRGLFFGGYNRGLTLLLGCAILFLNLEDPS